MEANPDISICAGNILKIDEHGQICKKQKHTAINRSEEEDPSKTATRVSLIRADRISFSIACPAPPLEFPGNKGCERSGPC